MTAKEATSRCRGSAATNRAFTERQPERVAAHLSDCKKCSMEWSWLDAMAGAAKQSRQLALSSAAKDELREKLVVGARAIGKMPLPWRSPRWVVVASLSTGLLVAAVALLVVRAWLSAPGDSAERPVLPVYRGAIHEHGHARYAVVSPQPDETIRLYDGTITVGVAPLKRGERFRVLTRDGEVEVHGTVFEITAYQGQLAKVTVERGRVEVRGGSRVDRILTPGEVWASADTERGAALSGPAEGQAPPPAESLASTNRDGGFDPLTRKRSAGGSRESTSLGRETALRMDTEAVPVAPRRPASTAGRTAADMLAPIVSGRETAASSQEAASVLPHTPPSGEEIAFQEGWSALRSGDPAAAARGFAAVPRDSVLGPDAAFWHGVALARAGRAPEAVRTLELFLTSFPSSAHYDEALVTLGSVLRRIGDETAAAARFREALRSPSGAVRARAERALEQTK